VPAEGIHLTALREAAFLGCTTPVRRALVRFEDAARLGAIGPDLPYFDRYAEELVRYVVRQPARSSPWGGGIHEGGGAIRLVRSVLAEARRARSDLLAVLAIGLASHASIDRSIHPLVNALARRFPEGKTHDASHREVEKFQSILFHERYYGADRMGTAGIFELVSVPVRALLGETEAGPALLAAFVHATGDAQFAQPLRRMARGYEIHARVLASPLGKRVAPPSEKERARPLFFEGPWGSFERVLEDAIKNSVPVIESVWAAYTDGENTRLDELLPDGTIEGQGLDVDLDRPFVLRCQMHPREFVQ
jgi:hypothetical protein